MNNSSFINNNNNNNPNNPNNQQNNMYNNYNKGRMSNQNTRYFNNNYSNSSFNYTNANNKNNINDNDYFMENTQNNQNNNLNHSNSNFNYYNQSGQNQLIDENYHNKNYEFYNFNKSESSFDRNRPKIKRKKILVLGAPGVGKSAVIMRFTDDVFKQDYIPTLQETYKKEFAFNNEKVELELNDLDGQNEFTLFSGNKFSFGINGYILCYSVENQYSFQMIESINSKLTSLVGNGVPKILIGNKSDLNHKRVISIEEGKNLAKKINASFLESSARSGNNIQLIFHSVLVEINKMESNIDLKNFSCSWFITFVIRNLYSNQLINYFLLIIQILINCVSITLAIYTAIYGQDAIYSLCVGSLLLLGIFDIIFSILGIIGICSKKKELISYYFTGLFLSIIFIFFFVISYIFTSKYDCVDPDLKICLVQKYNKLYTCIFVPIMMVVHIILTLYAYVFDKIHKNDLGNLVI